MAEEAVESTFAYPAVGGDDAVTRPVEGQPQPLDEVVYAPTYAPQQEEMPVEFLGGDQNAARGFASSNAPDEAIDEIPNQVPTGIMDNAVTERRQDMTGAGLASSETTEEFELETSRDTGAADFASPDAIEKAVIEGWTEMASPSANLSEKPGEVAINGQMEIVHDDLAAPNASRALDGTEVENQTKAPAADFTSSKTPGEAWGEGQMESGGSETKIRQEKQKEIES